jgi:beta-mannosidase
VAHERDVTSLVHPGANDLVLRFRALDTLLAARRPRPRWRTPMIENQQLRWFRTTLLGRTPGWSPPAPPVGPWRSVRLVQREAVDVADVTLRSSLDGGSGLVEAACVTRRLGPGEVRGARLQLSGPGPASEVALSPEAAEGPGATRWHGTVRVPDAELWWPHTHGAQPLYDARLRLDPGGAECVVDLGRVGFRTVALSTTDGGFGLSVNGVPVFCRGACWTPLDVASLTATPEAYREALLAVRDAGMNMIRVGGTMVYEADDFHDLCDELGIFVWQDFMFANMDYPDQDPAFLAAVEEESRQVLSRLQARPSLAVFCGNSEGEMQAAFWGAPRTLWSSALFTERLPALSESLCPDVPYWPSSASGGGFPNQVNTGTASYYGVGAYLRPLEDARRSEVRFASECLAFANVPGTDTLAEIAPGRMARVHDPLWKARVPRDLGAGWDFDDVRDHYLRALFGVDPPALRYGDHDRYLALSRIVTGEVMAAAFGEWRRSRSACRGALVWFLRDLWAGAGWGVLDASGRPKAAYDYLRRSLQPVAVFLSDEGLNGLALHVVNERPSPLVADLRLDFFRRGEKRVGGGSTAVSVPAHGALELAAAPLLEGFVDVTYAHRFGPPACDLAVATLLAAGDAPPAVLGQAFHFPLGRPSTQEADIGLEARARPTSDGGWDLLVRTRRFAQAVAIDADEHLPSDNHFHLAPESERVLALRGPAKPPRGTATALNAERAATIAVEAV